MVAVGWKISSPSSDFVVSPLKIGFPSTWSSFSFRIVPGSVSKMGIHDIPAAVIDEKKAKINFTQPELDTNRAPATPRNGKDQSAIPRHLDDAYWFVQEAGSHKHTQASPRELKAVRTKVDWRIVPIMFLCYTMQFLDKVLLNVSCLPARSELLHPCSLTALVSMPRSWVLIRT